MRHPYRHMFAFANEKITNCHKRDSQIHAHILVFVNSSQDVKSPCSDSQELSREQFEIRLKTIKSIKVFSHLNITKFPFRSFSFVLWHNLSPHSGAMVGGLCEHCNCCHISRNYMKNEYNAKHNH